MLGDSRLRYAGPIGQAADSGFAVAAQALIDGPPGRIGQGAQQDVGIGVHGAIHNRRVMGLSRSITHELLISAFPGLPVCGAARVSCFLDAQGINISPNDPFPHAFAPDDLGGLTVGTRRTGPRYFPPGGRDLSRNRRAGGLAHRVEDRHPPVTGLDSQYHAGPVGSGPAVGAAHLVRPDADASGP